MDMSLSKFPEMVKERRKSDSSQIITVF